MIVSGVGLRFNKVHLSTSTSRRLCQVKSVWSQLSLLYLPQGGSSSSGGGGDEDSIGQLLHDADVRLGEKSQ